MFYQTGFMSYLILPEGFQVGDKLKFSEESTAPIIALNGISSYGQAAALKYISDGSFVFNVEL